MEKTYLESTNHKIAQVATLISIKPKFKTRNIIINIEEYFIMMKEIIKKNNNLI